YSPKNYYRRVRVFLREYRKPKTSVPFDFQRLLALFRSSIRLGVIGRERFQYWKMILWTLFRRPQLLSEAITFAIYGYHFRRISGR
ncbi:MAG: B12-binding domain-containing radical SAM protein, partial [Thermoplasmata archaeon]